MEHEPHITLKPIYIHFKSTNSHLFYNIIFSNKSLMISHQLNGFVFFFVVMVGQVQYLPTLSTMANKVLMGLRNLVTTTSQGGDNEKDGVMWLARVVLAMNTTPEGLISQPLPLLDSQPS